MDLHLLARRELPPPPARLLEVGCGRGELALALAADGYEVVAVDPEAPEGPIFRRTTIEELDEPGPFDACFASLSLHHVDDLGVALDKVVALLRPRATVVVREFAWDRADEPTVAWWYEQLGDDGDLAVWQEEHGDLHGFDALRTALAERFTERSFAWTPYLYAYDLGPGAEAEERRLIEAGAIRAIGFVYVGLA
jgi:SAM-dependent methyltransferase